MREDSGVAPGLMSLPSGGGAAPLGDRFEPDLVRGSGGYSMPIVCPMGPNELRPALSLSYSTGSGNGPFGLGWGLNAKEFPHAITLRLQNNWISLLKFHAMPQK